MKTNFIRVLAPLIGGSGFLSAFICVHLRQRLFAGYPI
jgi:hypothetical protein